MKIVLIIILLIVLVYFIFVRYINIVFVSSHFKKNNVIVFGKKGTGKDVLFASVIHRRKAKHFSNIPYNDNTTVQPLNYLSVQPNTYDKFITDNITVIDKAIAEKTDYYISDSGIYLPSHLDNQLSKYFPSLPIFYALSRHLGDMNVHANTQALNRLWLKLREQADRYIKCNGVLFFPKWLPFLRRYYTQKVTIYENYDDALENLKPIKKILTGDATAVEKSTRGFIVIKRLLLPKKWLKYDTRIFHEKIYGVKAPIKSTKKAKKCIKAVQ